MIQFSADSFSIITWGCALYLQAWRSQKNRYKDSTKESSLQNFSCSLTVEILFRPSFKVCQHIPTISRCFDKKINIWFRALFRDRGLNKNRYKSGLRFNIKPIFQSFNCSLTVEVLFWQRFKVSQHITIYVSVKNQNLVENLIGNYSLHVSQCCYMLLQALEPTDYFSNVDT